MALPGSSWFNLLYSSWINLSVPSNDEISYEGCFGKIEKIGLLLLQGEHQVTNTLRLTLIIDFLIISI